MPPTPAQIKKIHALKGALGMADDIYRELLTGFGVKTSKKLRIPQADDLIRDMEAKAVAAGVWEKRRPGAGAKAKRIADDPMSKKVRALWIELHQAGKVKNPAEAALLSYVKRMTGVQRLEWLNLKQVTTVIEALKKWLGRCPGEKH